MVTDIGARLREFRDRKQIKMTVIESSTGIPKENLYKWEKGFKPRNINDYLKLKDYLDRMDNIKGFDNFSIDEHKPATLRLPLKDRRPAIPQIGGKAASGTIILSNNKPELIVDRFSAPFLGNVDGAVEILGQSMEPTFCNSCHITITRLGDSHTLNWGHCYYIIDVNWQGIIRRVYQSDRGNFIRMVADNPDQVRYPPIERGLDKIVAFFKIGAIIIKH